MIKIAHTVTVKIGEERGFEVVVNRATPAQVKQLSLLEKDHTNANKDSSTVNKEIAALNMQISETQSMLETNMELLKLSSEELPPTERYALLVENKTTLIPTLVRLKKERGEIAYPDQTKSYELVEAIYKKRFDLLVEKGEQKEALAKYAQEKSVSYTEIFMDINKEIEEEEKKKLKASGDGQNK